MLKIKQTIGLLLTCLMFIFTSTLFAKASVNASIETSSLSVGEGTFLNITVKSDENSSEIENPDLSVLGKDFETGSTFQSSSFSSRYANGQFVFERIRNYKIQIIPTSEGEKEIPPVPVKINGQVYKTEPIKVSVGKGNGIGSGQGLGSPGVPQATNTPQGRQQKRRSNGNASDKSVFVRAVADKTSAYVGEQIIVSYYLYANVRIDNPDIVKRPDFKSFIKEDLEDVKMLHFTRENADGVAYNRALLGKYALYPIKDGTAYIDTMRVRALAYRQDASSGEEDDDPFGFGFKGFFNIMRPVELLKDSTAIKIDIKPLPVQGQPQSFTGAVGDFEIRSDLNSNSTKAGQPVTLILRVKGHGNINSIDKPNISLPPSIEIFESKATTDTTPLGSGEKTFEYVLLPRAEGTFNIGPVDFSYFKPSQHEYKTVKSGPFVLTVKGGVVDSGISSARSNSTVNTATTPSAKDIRYIKPSISDGNVAYRLYKSPVFYAVFALIIILIIFIYFILEQLDKKSANTKDRKRKEILSQLSKAHRANTDDELLKYVTLALNTAMGLSENIDEESTEKAKTIMEKINTFRFAPAAKIDETKTEILKEAEKLIRGNLLP